MTIDIDAPAVPGAETGERVVLTSAVGHARHAGVLLPPVKAGEPHRVHTDKGKVLRLNGRWLAAPELSAAERRRDHRVQYCTQGRPVYRPDDLPTLQLATKTMLRTRLRRRPAEGQEPIASYMVYGGKLYAPLYAVADTSRMPPLPPARQAAWDQARTCARCRTTQATPYTKGLDARRYCESCHEPAARDRWATQRAEGRRAAKAWARGVTDDLPNVVLLKTAAFTGTFKIQAETLDGTVLIAARLRDPRCTIPDWWTDEMRNYIATRYTPIAEVLEPLRALEGRRLVTWRDSTVPLRQAMKQYADVDLALTAQEGDQAASHYDEWIGEPLSRVHGYRHERRLAPQPPPGGWENEVASIRSAVQTMAAGEAPALFADEREAEAGRG